MPTETEGDLVVFARLVNTEFLPGGAIRQTHECVGHPGVFIICAIDAIGSTWTQHFEARGEAFETIEDAILASQRKLSLRDRLAEAIRRMVDDANCPYARQDDQEVWRRVADQHLEHLDGFGLAVVEKHP